jgi:uncharacterized membrane protein
VSSVVRNAHFRVLIIFFLNIKMKHTNNSFMGKRFIFYGLLGLCMEVCWTGMGALFKGDMKLSAFTYIWMLPIYGLGVFLEVVHDKMRNMPIVLRGGIYAILIFFVEYSSGMLLRKMIGVCPWDYSGSAFSVNGVIRLDYFPVWFLVGLIYERIHDALDRMCITT